VAVKSIRQLKKKVRKKIESKKKPEISIPEDSVEFCKTILKYNPTSYQMAFLKESSKRTLLCWSRQSGKTTTIAAKAIWYALTHPETLTLIEGINKGSVWRERNH